MPIARRLAAAALAAALASACSNGTDGYGRSTEVPFIAACAAGQPDAGDVCRCTYDEIVKTIPFDRYLELDREMQQNPKLVPDEIRALVVQCGLDAAQAKLPNGFGAHSSASDSSSSSSDSSASS
jgi:hypothetical protein